LESFQTSSESNLVLEPSEIRFRNIAAILLRGVQRLREAAANADSESPVSENLVDSLPGRLELSREPLLSVYHNVEVQEDLDGQFFDI
jgi:hypothetical protein